MKIYAQPIYKSYMTYLPTSLPVYFYGMPDGSVYLTYARIYDINFHSTGLEFVIAVHEDFTFNYETGKILTSHFTEIETDGFIHMVDQPEQRIKILKVYRNINSYTQAQTYINEKARRMIPSFAN